MGFLFTFFSLRSVPQGTSDLLLRRAMLYSRDTYDTESTSEIPGVLFQSYHDVPCCVLLYEVK